MATNRKFNDERTLDLRMLRSIDGLAWAKVEFEERCRLRTLARRGVRVAVDARRMVQVDWTTVPQDWMTS